MLSVVFSYEMLYLEWIGTAKKLILCWAVLRPMIGTFTGPYGQGKCSLYNEIEIWLYLDLLY